MQAQSLLSLKTRMIYFARYYKKQIIVCCLVLIALLSSLAFAELMDLPKGMLEDICDTSTLASINEMVSIQIGSDQIGGYSVPGLSNMLNNINTLAKSLGTMLAIMFFCITIMDTYTRADQLTYSMFVMPFVNLIITIALITSSLSICTWTADVGTVFANKAMGAVVTSEYNVDSVLAQMDEEYHLYDDFEPETDAEGLGIITQALENLWGRFTNMFKNLGNKIAVFVNYTLALLIPWIGLKLAWVFVKLKCMERAVEIVVLSALSPIAFSLMGNETFFHSSGIRFLKQLGALCLQGAILVIIIGICSNIMVGQIAGTVTAGNSKSLGDAAFNCLTIGVMMMGITGKSLGISQKLFGLG